MGEHKFSKTAKPVATGSISREEAVRMRMITNLAAILLDRAGGEISLRA